MYLNGMVKKLLQEKQAERSQQMTNKAILDKPLMIRRKELERKFWIDIIFLIIFIEFMSHDHSYTLTVSSAFSG